jgi:tryptophanyl-tRNA synthetase
MKKRVLSGIRATGRLHLGNYLGAVKGMLELQDNPEYETFYMVADVHTITTPYNVEELKQNRREVIIDYLAAGLDPEKSVIFQQAEVPEHTELAFYFSSVVTIARMQHLPTFKEKVKQYPDNATMALLNYPILMSADILVYKAGLVPVGIDQEPHLEISRVIANNMNAAYGTDFPEPVRFATKGEYVPSLTGDGKMSKTVEGSFINITDDLETIKSKIAKMPTDSGKGEIDLSSEISREHSLFGVLAFVELFQGKEKAEEYKKLYSGDGIRYGDLKRELAEAIYEELKPLQQKRKELESNPEYVNKVIKEGAEKARAVAAQTLKEVKEKMGLG